MTVTTGLTYATSPFKALRKVWQYHVLTALREYDSGYCGLVDDLFRRFPEGFYVYAKDTIHKTEKGFLEYLARYVRHPAIAESRIISFDEVSVTFSCEHDDGIRGSVSLDVFEFFDALLRHLPLKGRHLISYLGLYSNRKHSYYFDILGFVVWEGKLRQRMLFEGVPRCLKCGKIMELVYRQGPGEPSVPPPLGSILTHWL